MSTLAAAGDTWGISGPTFLLAYLVLAVAVAVAGTRARRAIIDRRPGGPVHDLTARPHHIAYLNGGRELAVYSALSAMHLSATVAIASRGSVRSAGKPGSDALERAIHFTAADPVQGRRLPFHRTVTTALDAIEARLVDDGLLLSAGQRRAYRKVGTWMLAVAGLGLIRLLAGIAEAEPVGYLVVALIVVAVIAAVQLSRVPRRTRLGDSTLDDLREEHHALSPETNPDWAVYGPAGAALGVGIFGMGALWAADPAFADELEAQRVAAGGGADGGGSSWSGGGDSGSGDSGGGGGCGGGGGGCGGGGGGGG